MSEEITGVVTIVQEGRFQMTDDRGVSRLFILAPGAAAEPAQLTALQRGQTRVRVRYSTPRNIIGQLAHSVTVCS